MINSEVFNPSSFGCGPLALYNLMIKNKKIVPIRKLASLCKEEDGVTKVTGITCALNSLKIQHRYISNPKTFQVEGHLHRGGALIVLSFCEKYREKSVGHFMFIHCENGKYLNGNKLISIGELKSYIEATHKSHHSHVWLIK